MWSRQGQPNHQYNTRHSSNPLRDTYDALHGLLRLAGGEA
jgi:hypothetical protein